MRDRRARMAMLIGSVWEMAGTVSPAPAAEKTTFSNEQSPVTEVQEQTYSRTGFLRKAATTVTLLVAMLLLTGTALAGTSFDRTLPGPEMVKPRLLQPEQFPVKLLPPGLTNPSPQLREPEGCLHSFTPDTSPADNFR